MKHQVPRALVDAIAAGEWKNPGPDVLRQLLGADLPDLELFEQTSTMRRVSDELDAAKYVDDPEFCMVREAGIGTERGDSRLVFEHALFIAGSTVPGDDVFVAADLGCVESDPTILVLDWERPVPNRWVARGRLGDLIVRLAKL